VRVFLDTNVLVAAFATRGLCTDVMRVVLAEHQLITGEVVFDELRDVLRRRIKLPADTAKEIVALLRDQEVIPRPSKPSDLPVRDPDDSWILATALAGRAEVLVTGDHDLLAVAGTAPLPILDPRGFWNLMSKRP
jgi:putative PIN family toxin of toxin-antitoxin system